MIDTTRPTPPVAEHSPDRPAGVRWWVPVTAGAVGLAVLLVALVSGGGAGGPALAGLPDPGRLTTLGLPVATLLLTALGTITVGLLVTGVFLLPGEASTVGPQGYRMLRLAGLTALGWAVTALLVLYLSTGDLLGVPVGRVGWSSVASFATSVGQGQALLVQALLAAVVAGLARRVVSRTLAATAAVLAVLAVLPPAFTGHAAGAGNHQVAVTSLALHIGAAALWVGGLAALLLLGRARNLPGTVARYSRLALGCFVVTAVSGVVNAWVRLGTLDQLWHSAYGALVLGKVAALVVLGVLGAAHRRYLLPTLETGQRFGFLRLAAGELIVFGATLGLAVALSRTPTPVPASPVRPDPVTDLIGFPMPGPVSAGRLLGDPLPDLFFLALVVAGVGGYLVGVLRMRRAGHHWPASRTVSWLAGMAVLGATTSLGFARYAYVLFSVHMAQHMVLSMLVPMLLVGGAPVTLALRTLRRPTGPGVRGVRDWLLAFIHSRFLRTLTHPMVALAIYAGSLYALYFSDLFAVAMRYHLGHLVMLLHFTLAGYLMFWVIIGIDPGRRRIGPPVLILVQFAAMTFHAFFGVILLQSQDVLAPEWFAPLHPAWAGSLLADQHLGAAIAWSFGEIPAAVVVGILVWRWIRDDEREQVRLDRAADRATAAGAEDELARYNAFLARAAARDRQRQR